MKTRYRAQMRLPEISEQGQKRLSSSSVLIVGCGALGSPVAMYLAGAGIGKIILADFDTVELSNLHRQVFYREEDLGKPKVQCLARNITLLNSEIQTEVIQELVTFKFLEKLKSTPDIIVDAADNTSTTYLLDEFCHTRRIPLSTAGVREWQTQIFTYLPGGARFSDFFPRPSDEGLLPCSIAGIVGPVASFAASIQSVEVIKCLLGKNKGRSTLLTANLLSGEFGYFKTD